MRTCLSIFVCIVTLALVCRADEVPSAGPRPQTADLELPLLDLAGTGPAPVVVNKNLGFVITVDQGGKSATIFLPIVADATIQKGRNEPQGTQPIHWVRTSFAQSLLRADLAELSKDARIVKAVLRIRPKWREKQGDATLQVFRLLTAWDEQQATWNKPSTNAAEPWDGLRPDKDFAAEPLTTYTAGEVSADKSIDIEGMEKVIEAWRSGQWPNHGVVLRLKSGKVGQINFASREGVSPPPLNLGVKNDALIASVNLPLVRRAVLDPGDVRGATLRLSTGAKPTKQWADAKVLVYRMLRPASGKTLVAGQDYAAEPVFSSPLSETVKDAALNVPGLGTAVAQALKDNADRCEFLLTLSGPADVSIPLAMAGDRRTFLLTTIKTYPAYRLFAPPAQRPREGVYARVQDGHITYDGQRLKIWGMCLHSRKNLYGVDRLMKLGFNGMRMWLWTPEVLYTKQGAAQGKMDGPAIETHDRFFAEAKKEGFFIMSPNLMRFTQLVDGTLTAEESIFNDGEDFEQWREALREDKKRNVMHFTYFDERLRKLSKQHASNFLNHLNPYTGKRYAEDEAIFLWEIRNENSFMKWIPEQGFDKWPSYFRNKLQKKWNAWLTQRYGDEAGLLKAWGKLDQSERLSDGTITLEPLLTRRNQYPAQRGSDFIRFLCGIVDDYNQDFRSFCRSQAPEGVGVNVVPFSFDTQGTNNLPMLYTISKGDVQCMGNYSWTLSSSLSRPPGLYVLDSFTLADTPRVIYECNVGRPNPYRAEYPFKVAAMTAYQDYDAVFWHMWVPDKPDSEQYMPDETSLIGTMPLVTSFDYWRCSTHTHDPVMNASIALAGRIFLNGSIRPAQKPATYTIGAKGIFGYDRFLGISQRAAIFSRGSGIRFDDKADTDVSTDWDEKSAGDPNAPIVSGENIIWDWPNERLIIDSPLAKAYIGKTVDKYRFKDGITIGGFSTPFVAFGMISADGKPLTGEKPARLIHINAVADAKNTGFGMREGLVNTGGGFVDPREQMKYYTAYGSAPVVADRVAYSVWFPTEITGSFRGYDLACRQNSAQELSATSHLTHDGRETYMSVLSITSRGKAVAPPAIISNTAASQTAAGEARTGSISKEEAAALNNIWNPIPELRWSHGYHETHLLLREGGLNRTSISPEDYSKNAKKVLLVTEATALHDLAADIELSFTDNRMSRISLKFQRSPALTDLVAYYEKRFGKPVEKSLAADLFKASRVVWQVGYDKYILEIAINEFQGSSSITYSLRNK